VGRGWKGAVIGLLAVLILGCDAATPTPPVASLSVAPAASDQLPTGVAPTPAASPADSAGTVPSPSGEPGATGDAEPAPSAADLILADEAAGRIDPTAALLYRVWATFGDPRLPAAYAEGGWSEDSAALAVAQSTLGSLPPEVAAQIQPDLVRPTDPVSPFFAGSTGLTGRDPSARLARAVMRAGTTIGQAPGAPMPAVTCGANGWGYFDGPSPKSYRVWGECAGNGQSDIQAAAGMLEPIWNAEIAYMGRPPIPDIGSPGEGGDQRIDLYLVAGNCAAIGSRCKPLSDNFGITPPTTPFVSSGAAQQSSAFVLVGRAGLTDPQEFQGTLAHELFHVMQDAFNESGTADLGRRRNHWFVEASATWAEYAFAGGNGSLQAAFSGFLGTPYGLKSTEGSNAYWSFPWPLYMEQENGKGAVHRAWAAIEGKAFPQVTDAIDGVLSFAKSFRGFALRTWDQELNAGSPMDPLFPTAATGPRLLPFKTRAKLGVVLLPTAKGVTPRSNLENIQSLYSVYRQFRIDKKVGQVIVDLAGLKPAAAIDADALVKIRGGKWEIRKLKPGRNAWCMDNPGDKFEELVIVLANHAKEDKPTVTGQWTIDSPREPCITYHVTIDWTDFWGSGADGVRFDGYLDHVEPEIPGTDVTVITGTGTVSGGRHAYWKCNPGFKDLPVPIGTAKAAFDGVIDGDEVTITAYGDIETGFAGVTTQPFLLPRVGGEADMAGKDRPGDVCAHGWKGSIEATLIASPPP